MTKRIADLLALTVPGHTLKSNGRYTSPPTWAVYCIESSTAPSTRRFRSGNHPVRMLELERRYGKAERIALYPKKRLASELVRLLNA